MAHSMIIHLTDDISFDVHDNTNLPQTLITANILKGLIELKLGFEGGEEDEWKLFC